MICFIALFVFAIMSIFSAKYRPFAKRALDCTFRKLTLRPCDTGLDTEVKAKIISAMLVKSPKAARFVNKNFEIISNIFTLIMFVSLFFALQGVWNWYAYGNCNGPNSTAFCIYNAFLPRNNTVFPEVTAFNAYASPLLSGRQRSVEVIEFGCYSCPFTKEAEGLRSQIMADYVGDVDFYFRNFPLADHSNSNQTAIAAQCALLLDPKFSKPGLGTSPIMFWKFHDALFANQSTIITTNASKIDDYLVSLAASQGYDRNAFTQCMQNGTAAFQVGVDFAAGLAANVRGTPTFYVRNILKNPGKYMVIAGPQPYSEVKKVIDAALAGQIIETGSESSVTSGSCPVDLHK